MELKEAKYVKKITGNAGEDKAAEYLRQNGYRILHRNLHIGHDEIDIIAEDEKYIVFVEVKYRKNSVHLKKYGRPIRAVTKKKKQHIVFTAKHYLSHYPTTKKPRIDVIEIISDCLPNGFVEMNIKHYKNAFGE